MTLPGTCACFYQTLLLLCFYVVLRTTIFPQCGNVFMHVNLSVTHPGSAVALCGNRQTTRIRPAAQSKLVLFAAAAHVCWVVHTPALGSHHAPIINILNALPWV